MSSGSEENAEKTGVGTKGRPKDRSPNYPVIDLGKALEKAEVIHGIYKMHEMPIAMAHERLGYKPHSGAGNQCIAALRAYGLMNVTGQGAQRKVSISTEGDRIIRKAPDCEQLLKAAALRPSINKEIWDYGSKSGGIPTDDLLRHYLVWERPDPKFNEKSVGGFIADFRATLKLAKLVSSDIIASGAESDPTIDIDAKSEWHDEMNTATIVKPSVESRPPLESLAVPRIHPAEGMKQDVFALDEGAVVLQWPSSMTSASYEDFKGWIQLVLRKVKRCVDKETGVLPAEVTMILSRGLSPEEKTKLAEVEKLLSEYFAAAGHVIRVCQGVGDNDQRMIQFIPGFIGPPLVVIPAGEFLAASVDELLQTIEDNL